MITFSAVGLIVLLIAVDQWIKVWAVNNLAGNASIPLIPGVLQFSYVENYGGAFGIFQGIALMLALRTAVFLGVLAGLVVFFGLKKRYTFMWILAVITGGGIGNLVDRFHRGFVVDYIDFCLINYPVFNFADCCIVVGTIVLMVYIFFTDRAAEKKKKAALEKLEDNAPPEN